MPDQSSSTRSNVQTASPRPPISRPALTLQFGVLLVLCHVRRLQLLHCHLRLAQLLAVQVGGHLQGGGGAESGSVDRAAASLSSDRRLCGCGWLRQAAPAATGPCGL